MLYNFFGKRENWVDEKTALFRHWSLLLSRTRRCNWWVCKSKKEATTIHRCAERKKKRKYFRKTFFLLLEIGKNSFAKEDEVSSQNLKDLSWLWMKPKRMSKTMPLRNMTSFGKCGWYGSTRTTWNIWTNTSWTLRVLLRITM